MGTPHGDRLHRVEHTFCKPNHRGEYDLTLTTPETAYRFRLNWGEFLMLIESLHRGVTEEAAIQRVRNQQRATRKLQLMRSEGSQQGKEVFNG